MPGMASASVQPLKNAEKILPECTAQKTATFSSPAAAES